MTPFDYRNTEITLDEILGRETGPQKTAVKPKKSIKNKKGKKTNNKKQTKSNTKQTKSNTKQTKSNTKQTKSNKKTPTDTSDCGCMGLDTPYCNRQYAPRSLKNYIPPLTTGSQRDLRPQVVSHTMPMIERLFAPTGPPSIDEDIDTRGDLYPASYDGPPGPKCNWRKCSNKGGCGSECVCHPAGWYGWRCIPKCCIRADGSPPCRYLYKYPVQCTLPCHTWPGLCQENYWNPYHVFQGSLQYPKSQAPTLTAL